MGGDHSGTFAFSHTAKPPLAAERSRAVPKGAERTGEEQVQAAENPPSSD